MPWYTVTKTINGRQYLYLQMTYRDGGKVKTMNKYIGPARAPGFGSGAPANLPTAPRKIDRSATVSTPQASKRKPARPTDIPSNDDWSSPFWNTPRSRTHLREQAKVLQAAHEKRHPLRSRLPRFLQNAEQQRITDELRKIEEMKEYLHKQATRHFGYDLDFTPRGIRLTQR